MNPSNYTGKSYCWQTIAICVSKRTPETCPSVTSSLSWNGPKSHYRFTCTLTSPIHLDAPTYYLGTSSINRAASGELPMLSDRVSLVHYADRFFVSLALLWTWSFTSYRGGPGLADIEFVHRFAHCFLARTEFSYPPNPYSSSPLIRRLPYFAFVVKLFVHVTNILLPLNEKL